MLKSNNLRQQPKRSIVQRLLAPLGEISVLRNTWPSGWGFQYITPYRLDSSRVDYDLARQLYRNIADKYKLGAGFAKPIVNTTSGFMGAPHFTHTDPEADQSLEKVITRWTGKVLRINRNALRDGDVFTKITRSPDKFNSKQEVFDLQLIPPEWVMPVIDPLTGQWQQLVIRYPVTVVDAQGRTVAEYTLTEALTSKTRTIEADGRAPAEVRQQNRDEPNPWGFIPVVHFRNEAEENQLFGCSDLEPVEPFMKAYHDTMLFAVQGSKVFSRPKTKFKLKNVEKFLRDNFTADEIKAGKLKFVDKEIFLLQEGDDASFITADSGLVGITTLLEFIFMCIVDVSETPEFAFGTAVSSSKASVSEQMVPLSRKIRRKRGLFEEPFGELASMFLAMWGRVENRVLDTYQVDVGWDELSPRNDQEVANTIKTLVEGLVTGMEAGLISVDAAAEFIREFLPTALPYADPDAADDERRRIARSFTLMQRLQDGRGFEELEEGQKTGQGEMMRPSDWKRAYKAGVPHWAEGLQPSILAQQFVQKLQENGKKKGKILEIGCGNGRDSILFAKAGYNVTAIDVAPGAVELAKINAKQAKVEIDFKEVNTEKLPFGDAEFDGIFSLSVLHATKLTKSIPEVARVLKSGGLGAIYIYSSTQTINGQEEIHATTDGFIELLKTSGFELLDFYSESENEFDEAGEKHGILVVWIKKGE